MQRRAYLALALALLVVALVAVAFAAGTKPSTLGGGSSSGDGSVAPTLHAKGWINSKPLTAKDLDHKVVLYDFWTYSCVNCVRTIPSVRSWYDRYAKDGLVVIGVHSPEFQFEKNHANVRKAVKKLGVDYPVALDDDMAIWDAFANQYWPADYLYGRDGKQASVHFGEGDYQQTEDEIRKLLDIPKDAPRAKVKGASEGGTDGSGDQTPETYNGSERGNDGFASSEPLLDGTHTFTAPKQLASSEHALAGTWKITPEYVQSVSKGASLVIEYQAGQANLVMATADGKPIDVLVQVDDRPPLKVHVDASDLYTLAALHDTKVHRLTLTPSEPGLRAFAFTFGG